MRILHVAPSIARAYGGPTQSLSGYVTASRLLGASVNVVAPEATKSEIDEMEAATGAGNVRTFPAFGRGAFVVSPTLTSWVRSNADKFDLVHVHGLFNPVSTLSCRAAIKAAVPVVLRPFGTLSRYTFEHRRSGLKRAYFSTLERGNVTNCNGVHFTTDTEREEAAWHGVPLDSRAHV